MFLPKLFITIIGFLLLVPTQAIQSDFTYWIDPASCGPKGPVGEWKEVGKKFEYAMREALNMAKRSTDRIGEISGGTFPVPTTNVPDFYNVVIFKLRFMVGLENAAVAQEVKTVFEQIASYQRINEQKDAAIRFYCDNDEVTINPRCWTAVPDDPNPVSVQRPPYDSSLDPPPLNSQRPANVREFEDKANGMVLKGANMYHCKNKQGTNAYTNPNRRTTPEYTDQNPNRVVITFCDMWLDRPASSFMQKAYEKLELADMGNIYTLSNIASRTVLHEMFHSYPLFGKDLISRWGTKRDLLGANQKAYGWMDPQDLTLEGALLNVDTYVFYAFATYIADFRVCVSMQASPKIGLTPGGFKLGLVRSSKSCKPPNAPPVRNPLTDPPLKRSIVARAEDINRTLFGDSLDGHGECSAPRRVNGLPRLDLRVR